MSNTRDTPHPDPSRKRHESQESRTERKDADRHSADDRPSPVEVLRQARAQLAELTGMAVESVSSFEQTDDGWTLEVEVLELARVPDTMSLMASYEVDLDTGGQLTGYRKIRRYHRGPPDPHTPRAGYSRRPPP
ncbi:gas vesicle protein [Streptomyces sp. NPDC058964]|uniref:gas vesicle protein GvpO n=1 Tax=Streptomyces sp. NPDC058964 TaxID=3346681 RepID=UPI003691FAD4